jgi:hypothetical protein
MYEHPIQPLRETLRFSEINKVENLECRIDDIVDFIGTKHFLARGGCRPAFESERGKNIYYDSSQLSHYIHKNTACKLESSPSWMDFSVPSNGKSYKARLEWIGHHYFHWVCTEHSRGGQCSPCRIYVANEHEARRAFASSSPLWDGKALSSRFDTVLWTSNFATEVICCTIWINPWLISLHWAGTGQVSFAWKSCNSRYAEWLWCYSHPP